MRQLKTAFLAFGKDSVTRALAAQLDLDGFEEARDEEYESVRRVRRELQRQGITFR
jgi:ABC-type phosphate/phosphonate transport system substrate-binding protein